MWIGFITPGGFSIVFAFMNLSIEYESFLCSIVFFKLNIFILWFICISSFPSTFAVILFSVMYIGSRYIPFLSLCLISVFIVFPSSSNFHVATFIGVIIGSSKRPPVGGWYKWNPLLSLFLGISSGIVGPNMLSIIMLFPAFVCPSNTKPFIFLYLLHFIISHHASSSVTSI